MKTTSEKLISDLIERTRYNMNEVQKFRELTAAELNHRPREGSWSILECLEHLNYYGDFYLPEIERRINAGRHSAEPEFKSGLLGDYFAKMMLPGEQMKPMKTLKSMNPIGSRLDKGTVDKFLGQQKKLLSLLDSARQVSLNKTKTSISITPMIKLRLGDTFRVVIYHNQRHVEQTGKIGNSYE